MSCPDDHLPFGPQPTPDDAPATVGADGFPLEPQPDTAAVESGPGWPEPATPSDTGGLPSRLNSVGVIQTGGGSLANAIDETEKLLKASGEAIFQFGDRLVDVRRGPIVASVDHQKIEVRGHRPVELTNMMLRDISTRHIDFQKFNAREKKWLSIDCPEPVAEGLRHRVGKWEFASLTGIISAPVIRPDGTLIDKIGFDEATGLYVAPGDSVFPKLKQNPTKKDAIDAYAYMMHPLREVKFADKASESVAAAAILTGLQRPMLDFAPIVAVDSPTAGNGKGLVCNYLSIIGIGHEAAAITAHEDQNETDKVLGAKLIGGSQIILIDNVDHPLSSALLAQMMTESAIDVRMLGQSRTVTVPNGFFVLINGNNLQLLGDLPRRALKCRLDAGVERPELRTFESEHPLVVARRDRAMLVSAALTIMLAYRAAGSPQQDQPPLGSFNQWCRQIRDPLLWIGKADPVSTQAAIRSVDRKRSSHEAVMIAWFAAAQRGDGKATIGMTAKRLIELAGEQHTANGMPDGWKYPELREALLELSPHRNGRDIDSQRLGSFLSQNVGKIVGEYRIDRDGVGHSGLVFWIIEKVA